MSPRPGHNKSPRQRREITAINHFSKHLTHRDLGIALVDTDDQRVMQLANMLLDPAYARVSVGVIANKVGLNYGAVVDAYKRRKLAESTAIILKHAPEIMEDVAEDAKSHDVVCQTCRGEGSVEIKTPDRITCAPCLTCDETGKVRVTGDANARKLVFESIGLVSQRGPLIDARKIVVGDDDGLEDTLKNIARGRSLPATIDGEPVNGTD